MPTTDIRCDMADDCMEDVTMLDDKGYVYCEAHGLERRDVGYRSRKLRPHELNRLKRGDTLTRY